MKFYSVFTLALLTLFTAAWGKKPKNIRIYYEEGALRIAEEVQNKCSSDSANYCVKPLKKIDNICAENLTVDEHSIPVFISFELEGAVTCVPIPLKDTAVTQAHVISSYTVIVYNKNRVRNSTEAMKKRIVIVGSGKYEPDRTVKVLKKIDYAYTDCSLVMDTLPWGSARDRWRDGEIDVLAMTIPEAELTHRLKDLFDGVEGASFFVPSKEAKKTLESFSGYKYVEEKIVKSSPKIRAFGYAPYYLVAEAFLMSKLEPHIPWNSLQSYDIPLKNELSVRATSGFGLGASWISKFLVQFQWDLFIFGRGRSGMFGYLYPRIGECLYGDHSFTNLETLEFYQSNNGQSNVQGGIPEPTIDTVWIEPGNAKFNLDKGSSFLLALGSGAGWRFYTPRSRLDNISVSVYGGMGFENFGGFEFDSTITVGDIEKEVVEFDRGGWGSQKYLGGKVDFKWPYWGLGIFCETSWHSMKMDLSFKNLGEETSPALFHWGKGCYVTIGFYFGTNPRDYVKRQ